VCTPQHDWCLSSGRSIFTFVVAARLQFIYLCALYNALEACFLQCLRFGLSNSKQSNTATTAATKPRVHLSEAQTPTKLKSVVACSVVLECTASALFLNETLVIKKTRANYHMMIDVLQSQDSMMHGEA
jgi:hypothetical protein